MFRKKQLEKGEYSEKLRGAKETMKVMSINW
jgi:hypothetical protein